MLWTVMELKHCFLAFILQRSSEHMMHSSHSLVIIVQIFRSSLQPLCSKILSICNTDLHNIRVCMKPHSSFSMSSKHVVIPVIPHPHPAFYYVHPLQVQRMIIYGGNQSNKHPPEDRINLKLSLYHGAPWPFHHVSLYCSYKNITFLTYFYLSGDNGWWNRPLWDFIKFKHIWYIRFLWRILSYIRLVNTNKRLQYNQWCMSKVWRSLKEAHLLLSTEHLLLLRMHRWNNNNNKNTLYSKYTAESAGDDEQSQ